MGILKSGRGGDARQSFQGAKVTDRKKLTRRVRRREPVKLSQRDWSCNVHARHFLMEFLMDWRMFQQRLFQSSHKSGVRPGRV
jgi:hypothetical protein